MILLKSLRPAERYWNRQRLVGWIVLCSFLTMIICLPVQISGHTESGCHCSQALRAAGQCCCVKGVGESKAKSPCCQTTPAIAEQKSCCLTPAEICGPAEFCCSPANQICESSSTRQKSSSNQHKAPSLISTCGCGDSTPSGLLIDNQPRILSRNAVPVDLIPIGQIITVSVIIPENWEHEPETPPS